MGYLKQKKQKVLENKIYVILITTLAFLSISSFIDASFFIKITNYKIQIYVFNIFLLTFLLIKKQKLYSVICVLLFFINHNTIGAYANFFNNIKTNSTSKEIITYNKNMPYTFEINDSIILVNLSATNDFNTSIKEIEQYVLSQNTPVTIIGDLKKPLWHPKIKDFMKKTGLKAKNKMIFDKFNPFYVPTINVLGFDNIGIDKIIKKNNTYEFILLAK